jgi:spermidine dehydrogenase
MSKKRDHELGLDRPITRRDFVYGSALLVGGAMAGCGRPDDPGAGDVADRVQTDYGFDVGEAWYGPGGVGDYASSHGNTPALVRAAHEIRAGRFEEPPPDAVDSGETYDLVVVGGGLAGLSAAYHFRRLNPGGTVLVLDNHPIFGGEAKRNEFVVDGVHLSAPQGSNDFGVRPATGEPDDYFTALGIPREFRYVEPAGAAAGMRIPLDHYAHLHWQEGEFDVGHWFGASGGWVRDLWGSGLDATPWSDEVRDAFRRARTTNASDRAEADPGPWLDGMTLKALYEDVLGLPPEVSDYVDPILASIIGLGCDVTSAWWGHHFGLTGFGAPERYEGRTFHSFPGGNAGIARHFLKHLVPDGISGERSFEGVLFGPVAFDRLDHPENPVRFRMGATVVRVEHEGALEAAENVRVTYTRDGEAHTLRGRSVVMASGGWVNKHVVRDLPEGHRRAYDAFAHAPVLVANVALTNWRFLERLGIAAAMWQDGFGFTCNIRRPMVVGDTAPPLDPDRPTVLTFYAPIYKPGLARKDQGVAARAELLGTSFDEYERQIREQMVEMFDPGGFDPGTDIAGVILNRWGHAYVAPGPGFMFGTDGEPAPPDVIRGPIGRIAIGHSELRGHQNWTGATGEGRRAVELLLDEYF